MDAGEDITLHANGLAFSATSCGQGPVVLCLHGFPDHRGSFRHQLPALAEAGYRAVAATLRGYEPSSQPADGDYHIIRMAEDVIAWIDALGVERVHLVGHDWGAIISYAAAALAPQRFHSLTTLAIPHVGDVWSNRGLLKLPAQVRKSWYLFFFQLPGISDFVVSRRDWSFIEMLWRDWSPGWVLPPTEMAAVKRTLAQPGVLRAALAYYRSLRGLGPSARDTRALQMRPIAVPTLAISGVQDGCIDTRLYDIAMKHELFTRDLSIERIHDAGHFLHQECPDEVNRLLLSWLRRHEKG